MLYVAEHCTHTHTYYALSHTQTHTHTHTHTQTHTYTHTLDTINILNKRREKKHKSSLYASMCDIVLCHYFSEDNSSLFSEWFLVFK